ASVWFSQVVKALLDSSDETGMHHAFTLQGREIACDEVAAQTLCVQRLAGLAVAPDTGNSDNTERREKMWAAAFSVCSRDGMCELARTIIPSLDSCGWAQLGRHELVERHGMRLLESLPIEQALA
ncbi:hypothetical protein GGI00_005679, partial [Coemansia sp. RSA 2681]